MEPRAMSPSDRRNLPQRIDGARVNRSGGSNHGHGRSARGSICKDARLELLGKHAEGFVDRNQVQVVPSDSQ